MYAITRKLTGESYAIVGVNGRFDFPAADGPTLADLLDSEFPKCLNCEDRYGVCLHCGHCDQCDSCAQCAVDDEDEDDDGENPMPDDAS